MVDLLSCGVGVWGGGGGGERSRCSYTILGHVTMSWRYHFLQVTAFTDGPM